MVLRKPYAFLIRNFKLIHLLLTILMGIFFFKLRSIAEFLNEYIDRGIYGQVLDAVSDNIGFIGFLLPILIIAILSVIALVLNMKQKPIKFYIISIIVHVVEIIALIVGTVVLNTIQQGNATRLFVDVYYDFFNIITYIVIPFIVISLARTVGFNIKQFNFKKDLIELNIVEEDSEEFELEVDVDTEDIKAKINRKLRFLKYIYLENKPAFFIGGTVLILAIIFGVYTYINSLEKIYKEGHHFTAYGLDITVNESYKTKYASNGKEVKTNRFYIIVDLTIKNSYDTKQKIPYEYISLKLDEYETVSPIDKYKDEFSDFGHRFTSKNTLQPKETRQVILVYEINKKYENNDYIFEYLISETSETNKYEYVKVKLNPKEYKEVKVVSEKKLGETLEFKESLIEGTKLKIDEVELNKRFSYKYKQTIGGQEKEFTKTVVPKDTTSYKKVVMKINSTLTKNNKLNPSIYSSLYEKFASIEYVIDGKSNRQKPEIIDLTPSNSKYTYLEVIDEVTKAEKVTLIFTVRDKEYKYLLIDNSKKEGE